MAGWRETVAVTVGGVIGTGLRFALDTIIPHDDTTFPLSTLLINTIGSFALGALVSTLWTRSRTPNWLKVGVGTGVVGSFTTFSAFIVSILAESHNGLWWMALLYFALTMVFGFGAAIVGLMIGHRRGTARRAIGMADE